MAKSWTKSTERSCKVRRTGTAQHVITIALWLTCCPGQDQTTFIKHFVDELKAQARRKEGK